MAAGVIDSDRDAELEARVRGALDEVWFRNALFVAWGRVIIRILTLVIFGIAWIRGQFDLGIYPPLGTITSALHLAIAVPLLVALWRRPTVLGVGIGAASDLLSTSASAYFMLGRYDPGLVLLQMLAVSQVMLLAGALTMSRRRLAIYAAATWLVALGLIVRTDHALAERVLVLTVFGIFSLGITLTGARIVGLTAQASVEALGADLVRRHRDEIQAAHDALRAAQVQAEILSNLIVHDLRNPLASISFNLEEVRDSIPAGGEPARDALDVAASELRRVTGMTEDLLIISRLERRDWDRRRTVRLSELLGDVERSARAVVVRAGARLSVKIENGAEEADLDLPLVRRLLDNLVLNAARYVGPGDRVEIAGEGDGASIRLAVRNSGPPVPAEARARLFQKHATVGQPRWTHFGLGLYLCRLVAERHGGEIALVDRPGWNVSFEVTLPPREQAIGAPSPVAALP